MLLVSSKDNTVSNTILHLKDYEAHVRRDKGASGTAPFAAEKGKGQKPKGSGGNNGPGVSI